MTVASRTKLTRTGLGRTGGVDAIALTACQGQQGEEEEEGVVGGDRVSQPG